MSTANSANVEIIYNALKSHYNLGSDKDLAEFLGVDFRTLSAWKSRGKIAKPDLIIYKCSGLSYVWLKTGEGEMFTGNEQLTPPAPSSCASCEIVDIYSMVEAGPGAEPEWHEPVDRQAIPTKLLKTAIRPVQVRGRSMEPSIMDGAIIGVDLQDRQVVEGEVYAIMLPYVGAAVKRLYPLPDGVLIRSDNKEFPEVKIRREEIQDHFILGRVKWVLQEF